MSHLEPDVFDPRITQWKVENDVLFPRLRRIECYFAQNGLLRISQLRSFVTSGLRELYLRSEEFLSPAAGEQTVAFLNDIARIESLRLEKLKLEYQANLTSSTLPVVIANLVAANKDSISALELPDSDLDISVLANHSLQNLKALTIQPKSVQREGLPDQIQALVEVCPHVAYLRVWLDDLDFSFVRGILAWHLLSFELRGAARLGKGGIEEMAKAWPGLKKLGFHSKADRPRTSFPLSLLADIVAEFPELEDLEASFYHKESSMDDLLTNLPLSAQYGCPSSLRKLRLGISSPPKSQTHRDLVAEFLARALPPGLRIESRCFGPEWHALLRRVEELHGGVRLRVGSIPEENDGVWF